MPDGCKTEGDWPPYDSIDFTMNTINGDLINRLHRFQSSAHRGKLDAIAHGGFHSND